MLMLGLNETINQLAMGNSARWYSHTLGMTLDIEVEIQKKKGRPKMTLRKQFEKSMKDGLSDDNMLRR